MIHYSVSLIEDKIPLCLVLDPECLSNLWSEVDCPECAKLHHQAVSKFQIDLRSGFEWCSKYGTAEDWETLAMAYYSRGFLLNAHAYFKKADELRNELTLKNSDALAVPLTSA